MSDRDAADRGGTLAPTPEQRDILEKFVLPIEANYLDPLRQECFQHPPARAQVAALFCNSVESALLVASVPFQLCTAAVARRDFVRLLSGERIRALKKVQPGEPLTEALEREAFDIATARFKELQTNDTARMTERAITDLGGFLGKPEGRVAGAELLSQTVVMLWAALEVMISDTVRQEMNANPLLAIKVATTDPSRKHFNNRISLEQLASNNFNLERTMGDTLFADRSLDSLPVIRDVLNAVADDNAAVHEVFADAKLWQLWQIRHLIVHRRGQVDQTYIDRTGDKRWAVGSQISIDAPYVEGATDLVRDTAMAFLKCWRPVPLPS